MAASSSKKRIKGDAGRQQAKRESSKFVDQMNNTHGGKFLGRGIATVRTKGVRMVRKVEHNIIA